jgi:hypothetical protein
LTPEQREIIEETIDAMLSGEKVEIISGLIEEDEILATIARIDRALIEESFPVPNPDWPAVPWPPF